MLHEKVIKNALLWAMRFRAQVPDESWFEPYIIIMQEQENDTWDEICFEWATDERKLAIYIDDEVDCIEIEGTTLTTVQAETDEECKAVWEWLLDAVVL